MKITEVKHWLCGNGIAIAKNPYTYFTLNDPFVIFMEQWRNDPANQPAVDETLNGEYAEEIFGEPVWQFKVKGTDNWQVYTKNKFHSYEYLSNKYNDEYDWRFFLPLKESVTEVTERVEGHGHELKTWPEYFQHVWDGNKDWELRKNDRNYKVLDTVLLQEYSLETGYTGRSIEAVVCMVLKDAVQFGLMDGYCILSLKITNYNDN